MSQRSICLLIVVGAAIAMGFFYVGYFQGLQHQVTITMHDGTITCHAGPMVEIDNITITGMDRQTLVSALEWACMRSSL